MPTMAAIRTRLQDVLIRSGDLGVAGAVVGVAVGGEQITLAHGSANLNTGQPFTEDTGWLLGSVTKMLTTTVLLQLVERGVVDLDAPVRRYVPEFTLRDADAAEQVAVRMLLNHTNGIDADALWPSTVRGRDATLTYVKELARRGTVFEPGTCIHYSNPGFVLAARVIENQTGMPFERAIEAHLFEPCGMDDATALQTQAMLRRTAVGAYMDPEENALRAIRMFTLPESAAGAGSTPIVTVSDMLAFGRMHLAGGVTQAGPQILSTELVEAMQSPTFDLQIPQAPPTGLGWWLCPIAGTTALWHGGASPGGRSSFAVVPEHDAVVVGYASGPGCAVLLDALHSAVLEELTERAAPPPPEPAPMKPDPHVAGEYASFQARTRVDIDGVRLVLTSHFEPYNHEHLESMRGFTGMTEAEGVVASYTSVGPRQFVPTGVDLATLDGFYGRMLRLTMLPPAGTRPAGLHTMLRFTPKVADAPAP